MNKKPNVLILIMSANQEHFRSQIEDCKNTWLSVLKDEKYINIINKYINKIDWLYYDANIKNKYNIVTNKDNEEYLEVDLSHNVIADEHDRHHLHNILEDDQWTWQKTYDVFKYITNEKKYSDYDYVIRTNTSSYINMLLLSYILYREYNDSNIDSNTMCYGSELMSMYSIKIPNPNDVYIRGNCLILPKHIIKNVILKYGQFYNSTSFNAEKNKVCDDVVIGNILNVYFNDFKKDSLDYLSHYTGLTQCWYKCVKSSCHIKHKWSVNDYNNKFDVNNKKIMDMFEGSVNIQVRTYYLDRSIEHEHYNELHENMKRYIYDNYCNENSLNTIYNKIKNTYSNNPSVFIQGNLPFLTLDDIKEVLTDKMKQQLLQVQCFISMPADHPHFHYLTVVKSFMKTMINKFTLMTS